MDLGYTLSQTLSQIRYERTVQRDKRRRIESTGDDDVSTGVACQTDHVETVNTGCQTDDDFMKEYSRLKSENEILKSEKECLTMKLAEVEETVLSCKRLEDNEDLLKFYTGTYSFIIIVYKLHISVIQAFWNGAFSLLCLNLWHLLCQNHQNYQRCLLF